MPRPRPLTRWVAGALTLAAVAVAGACSPADGPQEIRFTFSKREAIEFMSGVVADYNA
jgi:raffinose/stachyose/melibiose transport system substrate-binding protein